MVLVLLDFLVCDWFLDLLLQWKGANYLEFYSILASTFGLQPVSSTQKYWKSQHMLQGQWQNVNFHQNCMISSNFLRCPFKYSPLPAAQEQTDLIERIKRVLKSSLLHPPPGSSILVLSSLFPPAGLQVGVGQGRPPFFSLNPISGGVKGIMAIWLRSQPYFMKRIFATWLVIIDTTPAIFHGQPPFLEIGEDFNHQCWVKTRWWVADHFCRWPFLSLTIFVVDHFCRWPMYK